MSESCETYRMWIKEELAGELGPVQRQSLAGHLNDCPACCRERETLAEAWRTLQSFPPEPVPRHFFVYEEPRPSPVQLLRQLAWGWKLLAGTAAAVGVLGWVLVFTQVRVSTEQGTLMVAFGDSKPVRQQELAPEIVDSLRQVVREQNEQLAAELKADFKADLAAAVDTSDRTGRARTDDLEKQINRKLAGALEEQEVKLRGSFDTALARSARLIMAGHREDVLQIQQTLTRFASIGLYQADQATIMAATLSSLTGPPSDIQGGN